jgi:hypothetical protein
VLRRPVEPAANNPIRKFAPTLDLLFRELFENGKRSGSHLLPNGNIVFQSFFISTTVQPSYVERLVEFTDGGVAVVSPFPFSVGVVHNEGEADAASSLCPFEHLQVAVSRISTKPPSIKVAKST